MQVELRHESLSAKPCPEVLYLRPGQAKDYWIQSLLEQAGDTALASCGILGCSLAVEVPHNYMSVAHSCTPMMTRSPPTCRVRQPANVPPAPAAEARPQHRDPQRRPTSAAHPECRSCSWPCVSSCPNADTASGPCEGAAAASCPGGSSVQACSDITVRWATLPAAQSASAI